MPNYCVNFTIVSSGGFFVNNADSPETAREIVSAYRAYQLLRFTDPENMQIDDVTEVTEDN